MKLRRPLRIVAVLALVVAGLTAVVFGLLHTSWARGRILQATLSRIAPDGTIAVGELHYSLARLRFEMVDVRLLSPGDPRPWFQADRLLVRLPWAALRGELAFEEVVLERPQLTVWVDADGGTNFEGGGTRIEQPVRLDRLALRDLEIHWRDDVGDWSFDADAIDLEILQDRPGASSLVVGEPLLARYADTTLAARHEAGDLGWTGLDLLLQQLAVSAPGSRVDVDGRIDRLLSDRALDLDLNGTIDLAELGAALGFATDASGTLTAAGHIRGPLTPDPLASTAPVEIGFEVNSPRLSWGPGSIEQLTLNLGGEPLGGELALTARADRMGWDTLRLADVRFSGRAGDRFTIEEVVAAFAGGTVSGSGAIALAADGSSDLAASWTGLDLATLAGAGGSDLPVGVAGASSGELRLGWSGTVPTAESIEGRIAGSVTAARTATVPLSGAATVDIAEGEWVLQADLAAGDAGTVTVQRLTGVLAADGPIRGSFAANSDDLGAAAALAATVVDAPLPYPVSGRVSATGTIAGRVSNPRVVFDATVEDLRVAGSGVVAASGRITADAAAARIDDLVVETVGGSATGALAVDLGARTVTGTASSEGVSVAALVDLVPGEYLPAATPTDLDGQLRFDLEFDGPLPVPDLDGTVSVENLSGGGYGPASFEARMSSTPTGTRIDSATISLGDDRFSLAGRVARNGASVDLMATAHVNEAATLVGRPELERLRDVRVDAGIGYDRESGEVTIDLWEIGAQVGAERLRMIRPARLTWDGAVVGLEDLELRLGDFRIEAAGALGSAPGPGIVVEVVGDLEGLEEAATLAWASYADDAGELDLSGAVSATLRIGGTLSDPLPDGRLELRQGLLGVAGQPPLQELSALLTVDTQAARLERFDGVLAGIGLMASGELPLGLLPLPDAIDTDLPAGPAVLDLAFTGVGPAAVRAWAPDTDTRDLVLDVSGRLQLRATAFTIDALEATIETTTLRLGSADVTLVQAEPTRIEVADGVATVATWDWRREPTQRSLDASRFRLAGTVGLTGEQPVDLRATGDLRLAALAPFLPPGSAIDGRAQLELAVAGTVSAPVPDGRVTLVDVAARSTAPRISLSDVNGTLTITGGALTAGTGITGLLNGGPVQALADLDLSDPLAPTGVVGITGRGVPFEAAGMRVNTDLDLTASLAGLDDARVFGTVTLLEGGYRTRQSLARALRSAAASTAASAAAPAGGSPLEAVVLDIRVRSADELLVDAPFAQATAEVDLRITGTATRPGVVGNVELNEGGRVFLNGVVYSLDRGRIEFADPAGISPTLDIQAGTRIGQYEVDLALTGDGFAPTVSATSDPALGEADVLSLMATGRTLQSASAESGQVLREQAFAVLSGQLQGVTRAIGLDSVRLEQGQGLAANPFERPDEADLFPRTTELGTRLTLARQVTDWFGLAFSQNLGETGGQSWIGTFELPRGIQARAGSFDDGTRSVELRHRLLFGRAPEEPGRRRPSRVDSVTITGETGVAEAVLRERLSLEEGDTFDFLDWQRDQDRLLEALVDGGYREARVRARREATGDVDTDGRARAYALVYDISAGPPTRLVFEGAAVDADVIAEMEEAWVDAIATEFLLDDLREVARRNLIESGYLEPAIEVTLQATEPVKEIRVQVDPGTRVDRTRVEIDGNRSLASGEIRARLRLDEALEAVWSDPTRAVDSVVSLYREQGWLEATAEVEPPVVTEGRARVRIAIDEGPRYTIGGVEIAGNVGLTTPALQDATTAVVGRPFEAGSVDEAVGAVVGRYLDEAYNDVRIVSSSRIDSDAASVALQLEVHEGARQVLADVTIDGRHRTRRSVIERAIDVAVGEPIGARRVEAIRRRLYQAEAFRSVSARLTATGPAVDGRQPVRLEIGLVELPAFELRYGVQVLDLPETVGGEVEPGLSTLLTHRNFLGIGGTVSLLGRGRQDELFGRTAISFPRVFGLPIRTTVLAQQSRRDESRPFDLPPVSRTETVTQLQQSVGVGSRITLGYSYGYERSIAEDPISPFPPVPTVVTRLSPLAIYDSRDNLFAPSRGLLHSSTLEMSMESLGSDLPFLKYTARQAFFFPVRSMVLATAVRFGTGRSLQEGVDRLDSSEFYLAGGADTVRGYPEDSLGRTPFFGTFLPGGDAVLILNQELRFPIRGWVHGVAFADAGRTFTSLDEMRLSALAASVGAGVRLVTPFVILRLDYGVRLSDVEGVPDASRGRFHFGIGHIF